MRSFWYALMEWSLMTFGSDEKRGPTGPLKHLAKEVEETLAAPNDLEEYADCVFLIFDAAWRAGFTYSELENKLWWKLEKNRARKWNTSALPDEPVEHIRNA